MTTSGTKTAKIKAKNMQKRVFVLLSIRAKGLHISIKVFVRI